MDPKEKLILPLHSAKGPRRPLKIQAHVAGNYPEMRQVPPAGRQRSSPEQFGKNTLYKLTPPAFGTEPSSPLSFMISSGRKGIFLAIGPEYKNKAT